MNALLTCFLYTGSSPRGRASGLGRQPRVPGWKEPLVLLEWWCTWMTGAAHFLQAASSWAIRASACGLLRAPQLGSSNPSCTSTTMSAALRLSVFNVLQQGGRFLR